MNQSFRDFVFHSMNETITLSRFSLVGLVTHKFYSKLINLIWNVLLPSQTGKQLCILWCHQQTTP